VPKHTFDHHKLAVEIHETSRAVEEGVRAGFEASLEQAKRLNDGAAAAVSGGLSRPSKRAKLAGWDDESDSDMSPSSDDGEDIGNADGLDNGERDGDAGPAAADGDGSPTADGDNADSVSAGASTTTNVEAAAAAAATTTGATTTTTTGAAAAAVVPPTASSAAAPRAPVTPEALDLGAFATVAELEALGLDRLKAACMAAGLKCGGTLEQRAERLWSVRGLSPHDYPASIVAGKK
jgi:cell division septation protein DedD